jgi:CHAD domain-containing protein
MPALRPLRTRVAQLRRAARADAQSAVASPRFVQLVLAVGAFAARPRFGVDEASDAAARLDRPARRFARPMLKRRQRKLLRRGAGLASASPASRHAARLAAKQLRYATEFFAALFPRRRTRAYRDALVRLQDILGTLNDASVAVDFAAIVAGPHAPATATLRGWEAAQCSARAEALATAWHHFAHARPFWLA